MNPHRGQLNKVSGYLISSLSPQIQLTNQINTKDDTHCAVCEAPSDPYTFKIAAYYDLDFLESHPVFENLPPGFVHDFFHELENQFLGHLKGPVKHSPFEPNIGLPKFMGFDLDIVQDQEYNIVLNTAFKYNSYLGTYFFLSLSLNLGRRKYRLRLTH